MNQAGTARKRTNCKSSHVSLRSMVRLARKRSNVAREWGRFRRERVKKRRTSDRRVSKAKKKPERKKLEPPTEGSLRGLQVARPEQTRFVGSYPSIIPVRASGMLHWE
jgi:hypothetical protein